MARPSPRRKGWRVALRFIGLALVAAFVALPLTFFITILMNPALGRLEARYGIELTGHSGPSDWIYELVFGITTVLLLSGLTLLTRRRAGVELVDGEIESGADDRDVAL